MEKDKRSFKKGVIQISDLYPKEQKKKGKAFPGMLTTADVDILEHPDEVEDEKDT